MSIGNTSLHSSRVVTHFAGSLFGSDKAEGGLFEDVPAFAYSRVVSPWKVWVETFQHEISDGNFAGIGGATLTDINTATSPTETVTAENGYLLINPGTKADSGSALQFNTSKSQGTYTASATQVPGAITSTATLMDNRELFWACRFGVQSDSATAWDGKVLLGWFVTDTTLMSNTSGQPTVGTGCGLGFHIGEGGVCTYIGQQTAITTANTSQTISQIDFSSGPGSASTMVWNEVGFRCRWIDASAGTGLARFFVNGFEVGQISSDLPMASTQDYSVSLAIHNGPSQVSDLGIDWMVTGITRAGLSH